MPNDMQVRKAEFNPKVCVYWLLSGMVVMTFTFIGIPFLPFWILFGLMITRRQLAAMECVLTEKTLKVKKGLFVRVEKTIPLEKITDMGMVQGPIMRYFDIHTLTIETAGQSGPGSDASLTGIIDAKAFREAVLNQRDTIATSSVPASSETKRHDDSDTQPLLKDIRDSLLRIEAILKEQENR